MRNASSDQTTASVTHTQGLDQANSPDVFDQLKPALLGARAAKKGEKERPQTGSQTTCAKTK